MPLFYKDQTFTGPHGQGYRLTRDVEIGDLFEPFGGAPNPVPGEPMPVWLRQQIGAARFAVTTSMEMTAPPDIYIQMAGRLDRKSFDAEYQQQPNAFASGSADFLKDTERRYFPVQCAHEWRGEYGYARKRWCHKCGVKDE